MKVVESELGNAYPADIPNPNRKDNLLALQHNKLNKQNGIPVLISSDGIVQPSFDPSDLGSGINYDAGSLDGNASLSESLFTEESESRITLEIMKNNANYLRVNANDIFNNLKLIVEWDATAMLVHITINFKDEIKDVYVPSSNMYPYPMDIIIPYESAAYATMNSASNPTGPDFNTPKVDIPEFNTKNWASNNDNETLAMLLRNELSELDSALNVFEESLIEAVNDNLIEVDSKITDLGKYSWFMNQYQVSYFYLDGVQDHSEQDPDDAQEWFDNYPNNFTDELESYKNNNPYFDGVTWKDKNGNFIEDADLGIFTSFDIAIPDIDDNIDLKLNEEYRILEGSLEITDGSSFLDTPVHHFFDLANKDGINKVISRLNQLGNWNVNKNPRITKKARSIIRQLQKYRDKE